jgi:hypothetical protein
MVDRHGEIAMTDEELLGSFKIDFDGSWLPIHQVTIAGVSIKPGEALTRRNGSKGIAIVRLLEAAAARHPHLIRR